MDKIKSNQSGAMLIIVLVVLGLFLITLIGAISLGLLQQKLIRKKVAKAQALHIAEAGVNYYRWVLYHNDDDYCNEGAGETCIGAPEYGPYGPYSYKDSSDQIEGFYKLYITPPPIDGSTVVTIKSIGWVSDYPNATRTIEVQCGIPSWSTFSVLANANIRFGADTEVWGPIHSNGGIRFDGIAHNVVSSALYRYDDPDPPAHPYEYGVHTHVYEVGDYDPNETCDEASPPCDPAPFDYSDVFMAGRFFPDAVVSFDLLDSYVTEALNLADANGLVLDKTAGNNEGYHITLNTDDTIDIRIVNSITPQCAYWSKGTQRVDTLGITSETDYLIGTTTPPNGIVFVKDNVWVDGAINGNRITILAFDEPLGGSVSDIIINNNLTYTNYDGTDTIGLIAQRNVTVGFYSEDILQIDAALIAKEGRIGRNYYPASCGSEFIRNTIIINGSLATRGRYGFAYSDGTGYQYRNLNYDNNLTYTPPPHFPTTGEYTFISWEEK